MKNINSTNKAKVWLAAGLVAAGLGIGASNVVHAATNDGSSSTTAPATAAPAPQANQNVDPAQLPNGPGETVLTGDALAKVTAAVKVVEPNATIIRVETDSGSHKFEAHITLADGTQKTLYFTADYAADGSDTGFGAPPAGQIPGQPGQPGAPTQSGSATTQN